MCHCAPVLRIHSTASSTRRVGSGLRPGRSSAMCSSGKCFRIRSHCWSLKSFDIYSASQPANNFEIGSSETRRIEQRIGLAIARQLVPERREEGTILGELQRQSLIIFE